FRWLLYGPLFAILLAGLVSLWKSSIPLNFNFSSTESYPTAVNILLGGPGQTVSLTNNLNNPDTFAQYIVALLMLWVVIILPFILLHVFLDYVFAIPANSPAIKQIVNSGVGFFNKSSISSSSQAPIPPKPSSSQPAGMARSLPFIKQSFNAFGYNQSSRISQAGSIHNNSEILKLSNLSIPTMRDIAKYETNFLSSDTTRKVEVSRVRESLERISNPSLVASPLERGRYDSVKTQLVSEKQKGNPLASGILSAASYVSSVEAVKSGLQKIPTSSPSLPVINRVQTVSFDDYESVRQLWQSNYRGMDVPKSVNQEDKTREEWINGDINKITGVINLLSSPDQQRVKEGMDKVSEILPMLLLGGFSQTEVIAYLKAKLEAAKGVKSELDKVKEEEETTVISSQKEEEKPKEMKAEVAEEQGENKKEAVSNDRIS
ncbi:MAG: hypothetical protein Q7K11_00015, partial [Candidatus Berkelbacteria bacterium]|nr:hypothetical protein [Candidatus Berkelbacteria bacterium]